VIKTEKKLSNTNVSSGSMSSYKTSAEIEYDALGQLTKKKLGTKTGGGALSNLEYEYNIRGWLLSVNKGYNTASNSDQYFAMELGYDKNASLGTFGHAYNGNISGTIWKSEGDQQVRKYDFTYDAVNRLTAADFNQYVSGSGSSATFNRTAGMDYSVSGLTYDANGNIQSMKQRGWKLTGSATIDSLSYNYIANSNKLLNVIDGLNDATTRLGDFRTSTLHPYSGSKTSSTVDYSYDDNGNMVKDLNKDLVTYAGGNSVVYNYLNLPQSITVRGASADKGTIEYTYDAAGNKLKKVTTEGSNVTTTLYQGGAVYINDTLQFIGQEEGRIRFEYSNPHTCSSTSNRFLFDYFIKDHLGNIRMVLTEQKEDICYIAATVEDGSYTTEQNIYDIVDGRRIAKATTGATQSSFGSKLYRTHGGNTGEKTGLGAVLKVMSGDQIKITCESYYTMPGGGPGSPLTMAVTDLLTSFTGGSAIIANKGSVSTSDISGIGSNNSDIGNFISNNNPGSNNAKAFVNYILFDDQMKYVSSGADPVNAGGGYKLHDYFINNPISVAKSGYIYIFVSNESNLPVYFDNLAITHTPGVILEENSYYPFGLVQAGISSKAMTIIIKNRYKYNGKELQNGEFADDTGLELEDYGARMYDPQIGRWHTQDPLAFKYFAFTPYNYVADNPIIFLDPDGKEIIGETRDDAKKAREDILAMFKGDKFNKFKKLIDTKGKSLKSISTDALNGALEGVDLSEDERAAVDIITNTINSKDQHIVEYISVDDNASQKATDELNNNSNGKLSKTIEQNGGLLSGKVIAALWGATTVKTENGTRSVIVEGANSGAAGNDYYNSDTKLYGTNPAGRPATTGHEIFGHGRPIALGRTESSQQKTDAIRTENLLLRMMGNGSIQRTGTSHSPGNNPVQDPSKLPDFR
jgi:RHS repeat-associated protein